MVISIVAAQAHADQIDFGIDGIADGGGNSVVASHSRVAKDFER